MKSKLPLRLDDDLKAEAKEIARKRGTSVSQLVENYFQLLPGREGASDSDAPVELTPRLTEVHQQIGAPPPTLPSMSPRSI